MNKKGYFGFWIPIYVDLDNGKVQGRGRFSSFLLRIAIWMNQHIFGVKEFPIYIILDDDIGNWVIRKAIKDRFTNGPNIHIK
jgi:hypothetical protein